MLSSTLLLRLLFTALLLLSLSTSATSIQEHELQRSLSILQTRGYSLFSNAIATSDIIYDVLSSNSSTFTFFAPTDSSLFTLDMTGSASEYINTLRCHVIPHRLNINQLRTSASGSGFDTLLEGRRIRVKISEDDVITVNGVVVALPGLYYTRNVAVHGLGGIFNVFIRPPSPAVIRRRHPPQQQLNMTANHTDISPSLPPVNSSDPPENSPINNESASNVINETPSPSPVENLSDVPPPQIDFIIPPGVGYEAPSPVENLFDVPSAQIDFMIPPGVGYEVPPPEVTETKHGYVSRRLISGGDDDVEKNSGRNNRGALIVVSPENIAGVMEMLQADFEKWDGKIFDCLLTDEVGHVSISHGYLYTRQQSHASMPCAGLHEFLHLQKSIEF